LGLALLTKTITHAEREFAQGQVGIHRFVAIQAGPPINCQDNFSLFSGTKLRGELVMVIT
jgi:hypothetical protein